MSKSIRIFGAMLGVVTLVRDLSDFCNYRE